MKAGCAEAANRRPEPADRIVIRWPSEKPFSRPQPALFPLHSTELRLTYARRLHPPPPKKADLALGSPGPERLLT